MSNIEDSAALPPSSTINNYYSLPTTEYRKFVDALEDRIKYVNGLTVPDSDRLEILHGAILGLLEVEQGSQETLLRVRQAGKDGDIVKAKAILGLLPMEYLS